jgi:putative membrane protein insertion efficiency factor
VSSSLSRVLGGLALVIAVGLGLLNAAPVAISGIHLYQHTLSPLAAHVGLRCRFTPTCSRYAEAAIARDGVVRGGWKAAKRIARCNPLTAMGTVDPP